MKLNLPLMRCPKCSTEMRPMFLRCIDGKLHGWLCKPCGEFVKAIGRERFYQDKEKAV